MDNNRPGYHEIDQPTEKRSFAMYSVKFLCLFTGNTQAFLCYHTEARLFDEGVDGAGQIAFSRVGFEDRKSALDRHRIFFQRTNLGVCEFHWRRQGARLIPVLLRGGKVGRLKAWG